MTSHPHDWRERLRSKHADAKVKHAVRSFKRGTRVYLAGHEDHTGTVSRVFPDGSFRVTYDEAGPLHGRKFEYHAGQKDKFRAGNPPGTRSGGRAG